MAKTASSTRSSSIEFPRAGLVRIWQILGCRRRRYSGVIPVSESTWYAGVASGRFPAGIRLGRKFTVWRAEDIWAWLENPK